MIVTCIHWSIMIMIMIMMMITCIHRLVSLMCRWRSLLLVWSRGNKTLMIWVSQNYTQSWLAISIVSKIFMVCWPVNGGTFCLFHNLASGAIGGELRKWYRRSYVNNYDKCYQDWNLMIWRAGAWEAARCVCAQVRTPSIIPGWKDDHAHGQSSMSLIPLMTIVRRPCALVEISTQTGIRQESPTTSVISIMIVIITMMSAASIVIIIMMSDVIATVCVLPLP